MFERFTDRARRVVVLAQEEARMLNHNYIGTEHLLLGLIHEGEGIGARALESLGVTLNAVREQVQDIVGPGPQAPNGHIPFTPRAKKVLELSMREAIQLNHGYIGTEHILLGMVRANEGVANQVLVKLGAEPAAVRQAVMDFSNSYANGVQVVIVKEDSPIQTVDDLANANMIGCQMGTTGYIFCSDTPENGGFGEDHVTPYDDGTAAVQALMNGQIDAVVIDNKPAQEYVAANPGLKILDGEFTNEDYAIGVAKGNTALLDAINGALEELTNDGTIQSIVDKYISAN